MFSNPYDYVLRDSCMTSTQTASRSTWIRVLQIGIGAIALTLSVSAMIYPAYATTTVFVAAGIILFLLGIEQLVVGLFLSQHSRAVHIGLGILIMLLASPVMLYPLETGALIIWIAAIALLIVGIASIISGLRLRGRGNRAVVSRTPRAISIGAGILAVALSGAIIIAPTFGVNLAGIMLGIALLFYGIRLVVTGVAGLRHTVSARSSDTMAA